jgi:hypothetical protein
MELRAFAICRGCFEVYPTSRYCPHCATDGLAARPPAPAPRADDDLLVDEPIGDAAAGASLWPRLAGLALVLAILAAAAGAA